MVRRFSAHVLPLVTCAVLGCGQYQPFDSVTHLRAEYAARVGPQEAAAVAVPFELDQELRGIVAQRVKTGTTEHRKLDYVNDFIFNRLELKYALLPTRSAVETYRTKEGNCLSFVNLFVGLAREVGLNPFYVEVADLQRWNRRENMVVSQGHIVAGMYVDGKLSTFDFLPYRPKSYRNFKPIDDLTAAAHYYNNLGAEALLEGNTGRALEMVTVATRIAPRFDKALNNLGVCYARQGDTERALEAYRKGLEIDPDNTLILTNVARAYQQLGRTADALALFGKIEDANTTNPYFFLYEGDIALSQGDTQKALSYMVRALKQDSEVPEVHVGFVRVYLALGDTEKARHHLSRALKLDATNEEARKYAYLLRQ